MSLDLETSVAEAIWSVSSVPWVLVLHRKVQQEAEVPNHEGRALMTQFEVLDLGVCLKVLSIHMETSACLHQDEYCVSCGHHLPATRYPPSR